MCHHIRGVELIDAAGCQFEIEVLIEGDIVVGQLLVAVVAEDEVEVQTFVGCAGVEVFVLHALDFHSAGGFHAWPSAECLGIPPGIHGEVIKFRVVNYVDDVAVVYYLVRVDRLVEIISPAIHYHIKAAAHLRGVTVDDRRVFKRPFLALTHGVECVAVGKCLAIDEIGGIEVDAPLYIGVRGFLKLPARIAYGIHVAVKFSDDVYLVRCESALWNDYFEELIALSQFEAGELAVKYDLVLGTSGNEWQEQQEEKA